MIACQLATLLLAQRMSPRELAKRAGLRETTVHKLYHDDWRLLDRSTLERLCEALQVSLGELLIWREKPPAPD